MSINQLPDELIMKIFSHLLDSAKWFQRDYMNLASTCRRFLFIGLREFNLIKLESEDEKTRDLVALYSLIPRVHQLSGPNGLKWWCDRSLVKSLSSKLVTVSRVLFHRTDINNFDYIEFESLRDSKFQKISELALMDCYVSKRALSLLISKLKNVKHLNLWRVRILKDLADLSPMKDVGRDLEYLMIQLDYAGELISDPSLSLPARTLVIKWGLKPSQKFRHSIEYAHLRRYMEKFRDHVKLVRLDLAFVPIWEVIVQRLGLEDLAYEIMVPDEQYYDSCWTVVRPERLNGDICVWA